MNYLKGQLRGNAIKLISGFPLERATYQSAVDLLKLTYENKNKKLRDLARRVINIKASTHNFKSLSEFRAELDSNLKRLENAGCNLEESSWLLSTILVDKLPILIVEQIQLKSENYYPSVEDIRTSLLEVINNLQSKDYEKDRVEEEERRIEGAFLPLKSEAKLFAIQEGVGKNKNSDKI